MKKSLFCRRRQERDLFFGGRSWTEAPLDEAEFNEYMQQYVLFYEFFRYQMVELGEKTVLAKYTITLWLRTILYTMTTC